ncbi:hypothetical protein PoB_000801700 [Plakobranchus ocellatus]|uniref:Spaetzle domain-containing protein n=1 Tax=Plakobranchus ocellatus TaxID=259542 RepID=A0AAV3YF86_9GAST|nr:hypothetical protein PoB_000801700 [Plakobranchus ocellatus]
MVVSCTKLPSSHGCLLHQTLSGIRNAINLELRQRPDVMLEIFKSRRASLREPAVSALSFGLNTGCFSTKETLESFEIQGNKCWVVFSRHQNVQFYRCRSSACGGGGAYRCSGADVLTPLWAWCDASFRDYRITKLELPLPANCNCVPVTC